VLLGHELARPLHPALAADSAREVFFDILHRFAAGTTLFIDGWSSNTDAAVRELVMCALQSPRQDVSWVIGASTHPGIPLATPTGYGELAASPAAI
jgi:hypothetical protein